MKIIVGLGSGEYLEEYVAAGADECFAGFVPDTWRKAQGDLAALNRREVSFVPVQLGAGNEMELLAEKAKRLGVPVILTMNSLFYLPEQYPVIDRILEECRELGYSSFLVADPALIHRHAPWGEGKGLRLHISGELGEMNSGVLAWCRAQGASRIVFHRKVTIEEMAAMIRRDKELHPGEPMEYEAFALNERCHFHGGFCHSVHCDSLPHLCRVPYRLSGEASREERETPDVPGASGCGLCALWALREAGITHLKLVSRGNGREETIRDIRVLKRALEILEEAGSEEEYQQTMRAELFPEGCSGECYYSHSLSFHSRCSKM